MAKTDIPFTDSSVSTDDPSGTLMTVVMLIIGFGIFSMASNIGEYLGDRANSALGSVLGFNPASGEDEGVDVV